MPFGHDAPDQGLELRAGEKVAGQEKRPSRTVSSQRVKNRFTSFAKFVPREHKRQTPLLLRTAHNRSLDNLASRCKCDRTW
jgi:hypothetical protein